MGCGHKFHHHSNGESTAQEAYLSRNSLTNGLVCAILFQQSEFSPIYEGPESLHVTSIAESEPATRPQKPPMPDTSRSGNNKKGKYGLEKAIPAVICILVGASFSSSFSPIALLVLDRACGNSNQCGILVTRTFCFHSSHMISFHFISLKFRSRLALLRIVGQ